MLEKALNISTITVKSFRYLLEEKYNSVRLLFLFGSRKSAKTKHIALRMILRTMKDRKYNALAMRKIAGEIPESIANELTWAIYTLFVPHLWEFKGLKKGYVYTYKPTGQVILMKGISTNPVTGKPSLSGLNVPYGMIKDVWLEEAWEFTEEDYTMIRGTVRGTDAADGTEQGASFLIVGNPYFQAIWCVKMAMDLLMPELEELKEYGEMWEYFPDDRSKNRMETIVHWSNLFINTKLSKADYKERMEELHRNPKDAIVTVFGYPGSPSGTILGHLTHLINNRDLDYWNMNVGDVTGGVDYAVQKDATTAGLVGITPWGESIAVEGYWHSNHRKEANQFSNNGVWKEKDAFQMSSDVIEYFHITWRELWKSKVHTKLHVFVDSAAMTFIHMLNRELQQRNIHDIVFKPTLGKHEGKIPIERRIVFEKQIMSRGMVSFLKVMSDDQQQVLSYPHRLMYEFNNIPWKKTASNGNIIIERDGTKVHPDMTNQWEYSIRKWMNKITKNFDIIIPDKQKEKNEIN